MFEGKFFIVLKGFHLSLLFLTRYLVFTTKHHEGFTNWPSTYHFGWNSMDIGPKKNVIKDLKDAFAENAPDVKFGLYYSLREWFNPIFLIDEHNGWTSR